MYTVKCVHRKVCKKAFGRTEEIALALERLDYGFESMLDVGLLFWLILCFIETLKQCHS